MRESNPNRYPTYKEVLDVLWPEDLEPYTYHTEDLQLFHFLPSGKGPHAGKAFLVFLHSRDFFNFQEIEWADVESMLPGVIARKSNMGTTDDILFRLDEPVERFWFREE